MSEEHDSWFKSAFGVDLGESLGKIKDDASAALTSAVSGVSQVVESAGGAVASVASGGAVAASGAVSAAGSAAKKVVQAFTPGAVDGPMAADCKPVRGQVLGPAEHVLCGTHGHILDVKAKQIIAASLADYKAGRISSSLGGAGVLAAVIPGLPIGIPGMPSGFPGGAPGPGSFPSIPNDGGLGGGGWNTAPTAGGGTSGGAASGVAKTVGEVGQIAMEGIAVFDAALIGGLVLVAGGVIVGLVIEVQSSEEIAGLPGDVKTVTATMVAGYRIAMENGGQPGDSAGRAGWLLGHDIFSRMRAELKTKNPDASDEQILAAIAAGADKGGAAAEPILRKKAQEAVWVSYASKHQDSRWTSNLNERFRAWSNIFGSAPKGEKLWTDYLNEHSNMSSPLANLSGDEEDKKKPQRGGGRQPQPGPLVAPDDPGADPEPLTCATQFPEIDICSSAKGGYGSMNDAAKAQPEYGRVARNNVTTMDAYKGLPGGEKGHATYYDSQGNKLFTLINRPCCMDTDAGPILQWRWVVA